jgi:Nickel responsive protein SCO4226-like
LVHVIMERKFSPAISAGEFMAMARDGADCMAIYRTQWQESLLARHGSSLICRFEAPDTESVRMLARGDQSIDKIAWPAEVHDTGRQGAANVVVERRFEQAVTVEALQAIENAGAHCMELHKVTFLRTFFSTDHLRMLCLYRAPDAESVRLAQHQAGMPVERVWACQPFTAASISG